MSALIQQFPDYFGGLDAEKATVQELQLAYEATTIAIKQKAIQTALAAERQTLTSKRVSAELKAEAELIAFRNRRIAEGKTEAEADALVSRLRLAGTSRAQAEYLDVIEETSAAFQALTQLETTLNNQVSATDKEKVKAAEAATKARIKNEKAAEDAAKKATARREKALAEAEKERLEIEKLNKEFADASSCARKKKPKPKHLQSRWAA